MADLKTDVRYIKGIGEQRAKALGKLGIRTLRDLISWFPRRYEDRTETRRIADLVPGEAACVAAMAASAPTVSHIRKGLDLVKLRAVDETGALDVTFFNQSWLKNSLHPGETYVFYGKAEGNLLRRRMANPIVEPEGRREATGRIVPVYPLTAGVSQLVLRRSIRQGLDACADILPDILPDEVRREHQLCRVGYAYENIHFPADSQALDLARRRFPDKKLIISESCIEFSKFGGEDALQSALRLSHEIIGDLNHGMTAFYDWNLLLDERGGPNHVGNFCLAPFLYDTKSHTLMPQLIRRHFEHFSAYLLPGSLRVGYSKYTDGLDVTAWKRPDGALAAVLLNRSGETLPVCLRLADEAARFQLPAGAVATGLIREETI